MPDRLPPPWLLVATPALEGSLFKASVVLITQHSALGSVGFIINRPLQTPLAEVIIADDLEPSVVVPPSVPIWEGGPVEREIGVILSDQTTVDQRTSSAALAFSLSASPGALATLAADAAAHDHHLKHATGPISPFYRHRFLTGYAGWGPGQLEEECRRGAWLKLSASWELVFASDWRALWDLTCKIGGSPRPARRGRLDIGQLH